MSSDNCEFRCRVCNSVIGIGVCSMPTSEYYHTCKKCRDAAAQATQTAYADMSATKKLLENLNEQVIEFNMRYGKKPMNKILSNVVDVSYVDTETNRVLVEINNPKFIPTTGDMVEFAGIDYKILEMKLSIKPECIADALNIKLKRCDNGYG